MSHISLLIMGQKFYFETRLKAYKGTWSPIQLLGFKKLRNLLDGFLSLVLFCLSLRARLAEWLLLYEFP